MQTEALVNSYDINRRSEELYHEARSRHRWPEVDRLALELEQKGRFLGNVVQEVVDVAASVREFESKEKKLAHIDESTYDLFTKKHAPRMASYFEWLYGNSETMRRQIDKWTSSDDRALAAYAQDLFSHRTFHVLNAAAEQQWHDFLSNGSIAEKPSREALIDSLNGLAYEGILYIKHREYSLINSGVGRRDYLKGESRLDQTYIEGVLNEIDGGIALLQASLNDPDGGWWVLPAPPQFEYLAGDINADFLLIDTKKDRSTGIQIKSSGFEQGTNGDNEHIVTISGRHDLGNSYGLLEDRESGLGINRDYSYAGNLAMAALKRLNKKSPEYKWMMGQPSLRWGLGYAIQRGRPQDLDKAAERVNYRIRSRL